jgi:hypothetical protein
MTSKFYQKKFLLSNFFSVLYFYYTNTYKENTYLMDFNNNFPIYLQIINNIKQDIVISIKFIGTTDRFIEQRTIYFCLFYNL